MLLLAFYDLIPILNQNKHNFVGCVPRTNINGAWDAPYDSSLFIWKRNE